MNQTTNTTNENEERQRENEVCVVCWLCVVRCVSVDYIIMICIMCLKGVKEEKNCCWYITRETCECVYATATSVFCFDESKSDATDWFTQRPFADSRVHSIYSITIIGTCDTSIYGIAGHVLYSPRLDLRLHNLLLFHFALTFVTPLRAAKANGKKYLSSSSVVLACDFSRFENEKYK